MKFISDVNASRLVWWFLINLDTRSGNVCTAVTTSSLEKVFNSVKTVTHTRGVNSLTGVADLGMKFLLDGEDFLLRDGLFVLLFWFLVLKLC